MAGFVCRDGGNSPRRAARGSASPGRRPAVPSQTERFPLKTADPRMDFSGRGGGKAGERKSERCSLDWDTSCTGLVLGLAAVALVSGMFMLQHGLDQDYRWIVYVASVGSAVVCFGRASKHFLAGAQAFQRHRRRIERAASAKFDRGQLEPDGSTILVRAADLV